jgi:hypothetical protein
MMMDDDMDMGRGNQMEINNTSNKMDINGIYTNSNNGIMQNKIDNISITQPKEKIPSVSVSNNNPVIANTLEEFEDHVRSKFGIIKIL